MIRALCSRTNFDDDNNHSRDTHIRTTNPAAYYNNHSDFTTTHFRGSSNATIHIHAAHITTHVPTYIHFPTHIHFPILGLTHINSYFSTLISDNINSYFSILVATHINTCAPSHVTASDANTQSYPDDTIASPDNFAPDQRDF
ncbi:hypothetical protein CPB97_006839 [Podila verticillata]|nr:hypothetical protein CPB97_006839 [Podila verticillata]